MNWYGKILLASNNFRFRTRPFDELPPNMNLEEDIDTITNIIVDYVVSGNQKQTTLNPLTFVNSYRSMATGEYEKEEDVYIILFPFDPEKKKRAGAFNDGKRTISIFVYEQKLTDNDKKDRQKLFSIYRPVLVHELVHALDPKFLEGIYVEPEENSDPLLSPTEFDAYCKQISNTLQLTMTEENKTGIIDWLKRQDISLLPPQISSFRGVISLWQEENPDYARKFFTRTYNDLFGVKINDKDF